MSVKSNPLSLAALSIPGLILMFVIVNTIQGRTGIMIALAILIIALFALAAVFAFCLKKHTEARVASDTIHAFLESVPMICTISDKDGNMIDLNREAETMLGIPDTRIFLKNYDTHLKDYLPEFQPDGTSSLEKTATMMKKVLADGHCNFEYTYKHKNGTPVPVEEYLRRITIAIPI